MRHGFKVLSLVLGLSACQSRAPETLPPQALPAVPPVADARSGPKPELGSFGVELSHVDPGVAPGGDFYRHVNGRWLASYELKPDEKRYGSFIKLQYRAEDQVKAILEEVGRSSPAPGSDEQRIADYYASYMDAAGLEAKGIAPLAGELALIAKIKSHGELVVAFGRSALAETNAPIVCGIDVDRTNPDRHMLNVVHGGLGLPDRSFYLEDSFKELLVQYETHIATMLGFTGLAAADAKRAAASVVALETEIARAHWPRAELRDMDKTHNVQSFAAFEKAYPDYPYRKHFESAGYDLEKIEELNVYTPSALAPLAKLVKATPLSTWKHYLVYHLISQHAPLLGDTIDDANFAFRGRVLNGQKEQRARWKRAIGLVGAHHSLGEAVGKLYVARHFPPESAVKMDALVKNLRAALKERIEELPWMGPATKAHALEKLASFNPKIGYPKKWRDFSNIRVVAGDLMANYRAVRKYWYDDELDRLGRPTDKDEWLMTPQTINAYYNPSFNEIVFPAAILQPPFFDPHADPAVNYGGIGAVIGHEMGHGFDDQGSKSDARGVQRNWWTDEDRKRFDARTRRLVEQYGAFEPLAGHKVNGQLTLGENIGDLGGLSMAYHAYLKSLRGKPAPVLDGFSGAQRFLLSWAQVWASKQRDEYLLTVLKSDPHSPAEFRVNGVVRNLDVWYDAFGVKPGDALYLPPSERVTIW